MPLEGGSKARLGRVLTTLATLLHGVLPLLADLTRTHVFHPAWPPHARMPMVWLLGTNLALAALAIRWLWSRRADRAFGVRAA